nr:2-amino-4-hydroxy-6-hydroxymethyldihydropteridine diphosphokinase [Rhodoferax sp.]
MRSPVTAYIGLGANLGDPVATLVQAMDDVAALSGVTLVRRSSLYRSAPVASIGPDYVNAVVEIRTVLTAPALLASLQQLEQLAGRARPYRNAPRTLDLDVLMYGHASIDSEALVVPHPRMRERAFVLVPLAEIAPHSVTAAQLQAVQSQFIERL